MRNNFVRKSIFVLIVLSLSVGTGYAQGYKETVNKGLNYANKGMYDEAIAEFNKAIQIDPNHENAYYNRGRTYYLKGNFDQAIADYTKVIQINPNDADTYYNRGHAYHNKNDLKRAITDYTGDTKES